MCRKGCERPFALHRQQPKKYKQNVDVDRLEKFLRTTMERRLGAILTKVCRFKTFHRSIIKTFHRSTMTDEKLTNLAMIFIESETAKTLDMTVDKNICISENKQNNICISENLEKGIVLA